MAHISLEAEFQDILTNHPLASYLEMLSIARERGWNLEKLTSLQEAYAAKIPARRALILAKAYSEYSGRKLSRLEQIIPTGAAYRLEAAVTPKDIDELKNIFIKHIATHGSAPMELSRILDNEKFDIRELLLNLSRSVLCGIDRDPKLSNPAYEGDEYVILMNRCLLRRTYAKRGNGSTLKNRNNQHWHQDSNILFQNRPMLTIWVPLQEGAGTSIPGIEIADTNIDQFLPVLGDGEENLERICLESASSNQSSAVACVGAGGCVVFNGLTFHRTYTTIKMAGFRDALLVRICPKIHASYFPGIRSNDLFFNR